MPNKDIMLIEKLAEELDRATRERHPVAPLSERFPRLSIDDAYAISLALLRRRTSGGEKVIGKKIGVTSKAVQDLLGVRQPDFGFLTDSMWISNGATIDLTTMIAPRAEAEIALILGRDLKGPGLTPADVLVATEAVAPCFEIVDSRIADWKIGIVDTVADNASCGVFVLGPERVPPRSLDLAGVQCRMYVNGSQVAQGYGSAVQGSPLASVAWLANTLGAYGVSLDAGDIILSGSLVPLVTAQSGDHFEMSLDGIGSGSIHFK